MAVGDELELPMLWANNWTRTRPAAQKERQVFAKVSSKFWIPPIPYINISARKLAPIQLYGSISMFTSEKNWTFIAFKNGRYFSCVQPTNINCCYPEVTAKLVPLKDIHITKIIPNSCGSNSSSKKKCRVLWKNIFLPSLRLAQIFHISVVFFSFKLTAEPLSFPLFATMF